MNTVGDERTGGDNVDDLSSTRIRYSTTFDNPMSSTQDLRGDFSTQDMTKLPTFMREESKYQTQNGFKNYLKDHLKYQSKTGFFLNNMQGN